MAFTQAHALVIGVGSHQYASFIDVPITVTDAKSVVEVLIDSKTCGYPAAQVTLLDNKKATRGGILTALGELAGRIKAEDTVFFYYCGHGAQGTDGSYYLVSHDAKIAGGRVVGGTGVSESELINQLRKIPARRVLMIFNACFSGNISPTLAIEEQSLEASGLSEDASNALLGTGEGRIIVTASREDQKSYIGSGALTIFTLALVEGLRGKGVANNGGYISAYSLYEHVYETVSETVKDRFNNVQEPELTILKGVGPFAVALYKGAASLGDFDHSQPAPDLPAVRQVKPEKVQKALGRQINTGGGAYIKGNVNTGGGDFVGRDKKVYGDEVRGDKVGGDKIDVGDINGSSGIAIGRGAHAEVHHSAGLSGKELELIFEPLMKMVQAAPKDVQPQAEQKIEELKNEIKKGKQENDSILARLIDGLIKLVPGAVTTVVSMFASPILAGLAGPFTKFVLEKFQER